MRSCVDVWKTLTRIREAGSIFLLSTVLWWWWWWWCRWWRKILIAFSRQQGEGSVLGRRTRVKNTISEGKTSALAWRRRRRRPRRDDQRQRRRMLLSRLTVCGPTVVVVVVLSYVWVCFSLPCRLPSATWMCTFLRCSKEQILPKATFKAIFCDKKFKSPPRGEKLKLKGLVWRLKATWKMPSPRRREPCSWRRKCTLSRKENACYGGTTRTLPGKAFILRLSVVCLAILFFPLKIATKTRSRRSVGRLLGLFVGIKINFLVSIFCAQ